MRTYRRVLIGGATYFFTVNLADRSNDLLVQHVGSLRAAFRCTQVRHPFHMPAAVVLPDHLHCIWELPPGDSDFATRWRLIKSGFSRSLPPTEWMNRSRKLKQERGVWQRRYWEHVIRNEEDFQRHMDYIHFNPVKHGRVARVRDWPLSSFHRCVEMGLYEIDWGDNGVEFDMPFDRSMDA
jgi:putative transposase